MDPLSRKTSTPYSTALMPSPFPRHVSACIKRMGGKESPMHVAPLPIPPAVSRAATPNVFALGARRPPRSSTRARRVTRRGKKGARDLSWWEGCSKGVDLNGARDLRFMRSLRSISSQSLPRPSASSTRRVKSRRCRAYERISLVQ